MNKRILFFLVLEVLFVIIALRVLTYNTVRNLSESAHVPGWILFIILMIAFNVSVAVFQVITLKRIITWRMDKLPTLRDARPADFPQLDTQAFDRYHTQLTHLGFEPRFYLAVETPPNSMALARLYYHPVHRCVATNGQLFQGNARMATTVVISQLDDKWSLSTFNVKTNPMQCLWRRPRVLWNAIPGSDPGGLLDAHLKIRQRMIDDVGVGNATPDIEQHEYFERQIENNRQNLEQLTKRNIFLLYLEYEFYNIKPIYSWMGDLEKTIRDRQVS